MLRITKSELEGYLKLANKERERIDKLIKSYSSKGEKVPAFVLQQNYTVKKVIRQLTIINNENKGDSFIDYSTIEALKGYSK